MKKILIQHERKENKNFDIKQKALQQLAHIY